MYSWSSNRVRMLVSVVMLALVSVGAVLNTVINASILLYKSVIDSNLSRTYFLSSIDTFVNASLPEGPAGGRCATCCANACA
ncbi:hypothetical protein BJ741DRAFT_610070 [Chytriomyces cf. hyalinus JEL632]|nr:hypothetical protein BJ741DRAFT_610070 [Chytriomyces cf. hyalinus JEL632]